MRHLTTRIFIPMERSRHFQRMMAISIIYSSLFGCEKPVKLRPSGFAGLDVDESSTIRKHRHTHPDMLWNSQRRLVLRGGSEDHDSNPAQNGAAVSEPDSYFETSSDSAVKRGEVARPPWGFMSEVVPTGSLHEELLYQAEGKTPPAYDPDKHNHDFSGDIGIVWTQFAPGEPRPAGLPSGLAAMRFNSPLYDSSPDTSDMDPIDAWLGRPGMIFVDELLPGSPAHACGLIEIGDKLVGLRVREGDYIEMTAWPMRNAIEAIVGKVDEPVQLRLQRPWIRASKRRLRRRQRRWENLLQDDADIRRGLEIASGARGRDFLDELEEDSDADRVRYEYVDVVLVRKPRHTFEAIANGTAEQQERRLNSSGPLLYALAAEAIDRSRQQAWSRRPVWAPDPAAAAAEDAHGGSVAKALRAVLDAAATSGRGVMLPAREFDLGETDLRVMDACAAGINAHVHVRGSAEAAPAGAGGCGAPLGSQGMGCEATGAELLSSDGEMDGKAGSSTGEGLGSQGKGTVKRTIIRGRCVLGTSMPWQTAVQAYNSGWEIPPEQRPDPLHPWIRLPLLCNAGGSFEGVWFAGEGDHTSCLAVLNGLWRVSQCRLETRHARGKVVSVTDEASLVLEDAEVGGGCRYGVSADKHAAVVMERTAVRGLETGLMALDDAAAWCGRCAFEGCGAAVFVGDAAQVRAHACAWDGNECALAARVLSCTGGVDCNVNEHAEVELVGCRVRGRLWREDQGMVWRVRCFVDVGNVYV